LSFLKVTVRLGLFGSPYQHIGPSEAKTKLMSKCIALLMLATLAIGPAAAQRPPLVPPQTVADVEFTIRSANIEMIAPPGNAAIPTARFSIGMTNRGKSSIGLVIDAKSSGGSTDTGLDFKSFAHNLARGLEACDDCRRVSDASWVVLQPGQTDNVLVAFFTRGSLEKKHGRAETMDVTLVLLVKESNGGTTRVPLSWADIPITNEIK
jgi:acetaldehyde dehydrogenase (acetylating)